MASLGLGPEDEVLVPAYHCGSEIEALVGAGLRCRFYEASDTLEPDADEMAKLLGPRTRALLIIHYLGFPQQAGRWRRWCDERDLLLLEDCAHAWLGSLGGRPLGSFGDLAIFSFPKTFGLSDGGAGVIPTRDGNAPLAAPPARRAPRSHAAALVKRHLSWSMTRSSLLDRLLARSEREYREDLSTGDPAAPSAATKLLLPHLPYREALNRRRAHYAALLEQAPDAVPAPFRQLPEGACPLVFPLAEHDHDDGVAFFERRGILARPFWPQRHAALPQSDFPGASSWQRRFIALPVHQELTADQLDRVCSALRERAAG